MTYPQLMSSASCLFSPSSTHGAPATQNSVHSGMGGRGRPLLAPGPLHILLSVLELSFTTTTTTTTASLIHSYSFFKSWI